MIKTIVKIIIIVLFISELLKEQIKNITKKRTTSTVLGLIGAIVLMICGIIMIVGEFV